MNTEKETWVNTILHSGVALKDLEVPSAVDLKVLSAVEKLNSDQLISTSRLRLGIAACLALVLLNALVLGMEKSTRVEKVEAGLNSYSLNIYQSE